MVRQNVDSRARYSNSQYREQEYERSTGGAHTHGQPQRKSATQQTQRGHKQVYEYDSAERKGNYVKIVN